MFTSAKGINPHWFVGTVVDKNDPINEGRVRVFCFGVHPTETTVSPEDALNVVEREDLPWAVCINGAYGALQTIPDEGEWVFGFFIDGRDAQHPMILGTIPGMNTEDFSGTNAPGSAANAPSTTPTTIDGRAAPLSQEEIDRIINGEESEAARKNAEAFLGREMSDEEWATLVKTTVAEASPNNPQEQAYVMATVLNRVKANGYPDDVISVVNQRNQFQAVTGTRFDPGPSNNFVNPAQSQIASTYVGVNEYLSQAGNWTNFTAANPAAYGAGTNVGFIDDVSSASNSVAVGGTIFGTVGS